jgi:glycosyltransferase involved in cell wall biosynthesis
MPRQEESCMPDVSVIIPTYNRSALLPRAIDSVLRQTHQSFEVLVVDDGSTDSTAEVLSQQSDPRVRYLPQLENMGAAAARNRGLREAAGRFIAFLDCDDEWMPQKLSRQLERFEELPEEYGLVYTAVEMAGEREGHRPGPPTHRGDIYVPLLHENVVYGGCSNVMLRRGVLVRCGYFDETLRAMEDYDYWLRIAQFYRVDFVGERLMRYHNAESKTAGSPGQQQRVSEDFEANVAARERLYTRYRPAIRSAGAEHLVLLDLARRCLSQPGGSEPGRSALLRAWRARPFSLRVFPYLLYMLLPEGGRRHVRTAEQFLYRRFSHTVVGSPSGAEG